MKFLVVLALLALAMAEPEADAQLLYHTGYPYYNYNGYNAYHPYNYGYAGYPHAYHTYSKREAEPLSNEKQGTANRLRDSNLSHLVDQYRTNNF